jgi:hypothetical protein
MTNPGGTPSTPSRLLRNSTTKATDHELQKYDNFTRYGQAAQASGVMLSSDRLDAGSSDDVTPFRNFVGDALAHCVGSAGDDFEAVVT